MAKKIVLLLVITAYQTVLAKGIILGDQPVNSTSSFSFIINKLLKQDITNGYFYVASPEDLTGDAKKYTLAGTTANALLNTANSFVPFAPEKVTLNGTANSNNPLHGAGVVQIGMIGTQLAAVPSADTTSLYLITSKLSSSTQTMVSITGCKDADGNDSAGFVTILDGGIHENMTTITGFGSTLFAAVKAFGGQFGDAGGGIGLFTKNTNNITQEKAVPGNNNDVLSILIDNSSSVLKVDEDLTSIGQNKIDLYWDNSLQRLYGSVHISNSGATGGRAVFMGYLSTEGTNKKLNIVEIAPVSAFTADSATEIVGTTVGASNFCIYHVKTMHTSTGLSYLIVQGNAQGENTNVFYALPLVDESVNPNKKNSYQTSTVHGTLAQADSTPTTYYATSTKNNTQYLSGRGFQTQATTPGDLLKDSNQAAKIGGGPIFYNDVSDMHVYNDAVFVATQGNDNGQKGGIFYSQPIFNTEGKIVNWTAWERVYYDATIGDDTTILFPKSFGFDQISGRFFVLTTSDGEINTVKRSNWGANPYDELLGGTTTNSSVGLLEQIKVLFPENTGGVMGLFDFNGSNPAFAVDADGLSLLIATGYKKVALIKSSSDSDLNPTIGDFTVNKRTFINGSLGTTSVEGNGIQATTVLITVSGGDLETLGAITSATLIEDPTDADRGGYLVVGGVGGVALLRDTDTRAGWAESGLVQDLSTGLGTNLAFDIIGNYSNVRKLWTATTTASAQALYILTDTALYRIDAANLNAAHPTAVTLATLADLGLSSSDSFADFIASKRLGLLATSAGLYRTGNGKNISTATNSTDVNWTKVTLPESYTGITKLIPLAGTSTDYTAPLLYEFADGQPGQVYYIASSVSYQNAALNRLAITDASTSVNAHTVQTVSYPIIKNSSGTAVNNPFSFLGAYRGNFITNGSSLLITSPSQIGITTQLNRLPLDTGNGRGFNYQLQKTIDLGLETHNTTITGITKSSATGTYIVYGDFGLRTLE